MKGTEVEKVCHLCKSFMANIPTCPPSQQFKIDIVFFLSNKIDIV